MFHLIRLCLQHAFHFVRLVLYYNFSYIVRGLLVYMVVLAITLSVRGLKFVVTSIPLPFDVFAIAQTWTPPSFLSLLAALIGVSFTLYLPLRRFRFWYLRHYSKSIFTRLFVDGSPSSLSDRIVRASECCVCSQRWATGMTLVELNCQHVMCEKCTTTWIKSCVKKRRVPNCPLCRAVLTSCTRFPITTLDAHTTGTATRSKTKAFISRV